LTARTVDGAVAAHGKQSATAVEQPARPAKVAAQALRVTMTA
jgi:hypothetical protein